MTTNDRIDNTTIEASADAAPPALDSLNQELEPAEPEWLVRWAHLAFGHRLVMSSSFGSDSAATLHLVTRIVPKIPVVFVDTGYLFPETYRFAERLTRLLNLNVRVYTPATTAARQEALFGRAWEGSDEDVARYNAINKVEPMQRALRDLDAAGWISGVRGEQTEVRAALRPVEQNRDGVFKIHPLLRWSRADVDSYMRRHGLPYHPLRAAGYRSIGDVHSTRPVAAGESERAGRRLGAHSECGLHLPGQAAA